MIPGLKHRSSESYCGMAIAALEVKWNVLYFRETCLPAFLSGFQIPLAFLPGPPPYIYKYIS